MYHYLNTKCGLFFIAFSPSYLYSIHILFPFSCSATILFPIHSLLCSVFLYAFIISPCPCISKILFTWGEEKFFLAFFSWLSIIFNSLRLSPFFLSIIWFFPFPLSAVQSSSLFQNFWFSVLPLTTYFAAASIHWLHVLLPLSNEMFGFFQTSMSLYFLSKAQIT